MFKPLLLLCVSLSLISDHISANTTNNLPPNKIQSTSASSPINTTPSNLLSFIPNGYVLQELYKGDLNKDGQEDYALLIKATDKSQWVVDEMRGALDRNRRGIIIAFKKDNGYKKIVANLSAFASKNEDGGVYFAPNLMISIEKGTLHIHYAHGRYGYWTYIFHYQKSKFELIGYDVLEMNQWILTRSVSINFNTQKMLIKTNTNRRYGEAEKLVENWYNINFPTLINLEDIDDFNQLTSKLSKVIYQAQ